MNTESFFPQIINIFEYPQRAHENNDLKVNCPFSVVVDFNCFSPFVISVVTQVNVRLLKGTEILFTYHLLE